MNVYCRSCRARHKVILTHGCEMTKYHGMWWFVDRHPRTANIMPITGATQLTRESEAASKLALRRKQKERAR